MKSLLVGIAALPFLVGVAMAGQPAPLSDAQMDQVVAGLDVHWSFNAGGVFVNAGYTNTTGTAATVCPSAACGTPPGTNFVSSTFPSLDGALNPGLPITVQAGVL